MDRLAMDRQCELHRWVLTLQMIWMLRLNKRRYRLK